MQKRFASPYFLSSRLALALCPWVIAACGALPTAQRGTPDAAPAAETVRQQDPTEPAPVAKEEVERRSRIVKGTGSVIKTGPPAAAAARERPEITLNLEGLDIREAAKLILGDYLGESYTVHPAVTGAVTLRTVRPISKAALLPMLEILLRQNGAAVVREEGIFKILPVNQLRGSLSPQAARARDAIPPGYSILVVPLKFVGAREMAKILEPFAPENSVRVDETRNLVLLSGNRRELDHLLDTVEMFDVDWISGFSIGIFPVKSVDVKTLVTEFDKLAGPAATSPLTGIVRVVPIERMNALLVVTTQPAYLETARTWIERLDETGVGGGARLFVYQVRNGKAEALAQLLGDLFGARAASAPAVPALAPGSRPAQVASPAPATPGPAARPAAGAPSSLASSTVAQPGSVSFSPTAGGAMTSGQVRVIADKDNNALLILASVPDYELILSALKKLDVTPKQVLVEVTVAEVTLTDDLRFGVDWFLTGRSVGQSSVTSGALNMGGLPATPTGAVPAFTGLQLINRLGGDVRGVLNALGKDGRLQVLATPQLMVLDNQKAQIKIGDRISVQTQQQTVAGTTSGLINSFQYLDTGILLAVTPRINSGGQVTLEVNQEVSVPLPASVAGANPDISQRTTTTTVVVASGESVVLGGLIREDNSRATSGVPLLSKIPVLGAAFGSQNITRRRTETILLIRPVVLTNVQSAAEATAELRRRMPALEAAITPPKSK